MTSFAPEQNSLYAETSYWDARFSKEDSYEWCKSYSEFKHLLAPFLKPSHAVLIIGCGNSSLPFDLWNDGFKNVTSIDTSQVSASW